MMMEDESWSSKHRYVKLEPPENVNLCGKDDKLNVRTDDKQVDQRGVRKESSIVHLPTLQVPFAHLPTLPFAHCPPSQEMADIAP